MSNVTEIFPANDFGVVCDNAKQELEVGLIVGYGEEGQLMIFGGGMINGRQPVGHDWLWMVETFKQNLVNGDYSE